MCSVFFPKETPWLRDLEDELFAFPNDRHDDQVDSISQALGHAVGWESAIRVVPGLVTYDAVVNRQSTDIITR
jgi:hypothetical protein